jgi:chromosomal replication initiator protein
MLEGNSDDKLLADERILSYSTAWSDSIKSLSQITDPQIFSAYLKPLRFSSVNSETGELVVAAPSKFVCSQIERGFREQLLKELSLRLRNLPLALSFSIDEESFDKNPPEEQYVVVKKLRPAEAPASQQYASGLSLPTGLNQRYLFDNFVVGSSNQFCHAAAIRVAEEPGKSYNPLFIYGGVGLGKTHLLHSIGNEALRCNPEKKVLYLSSEAFTNELIHALRHAKMDEFKQRLRGIDVLLIDDIQFIVGKERTQEEFFHTFNALYEGKRQIVLTSDKMPSDIPGIEERLQTRFSWGLMADLQAPDFETRVAIIKRKAALENFKIPEEVSHLIAERISSNVRELEGALTRLHALSSLQKIVVTAESAEEMLKPLIQPKVVRITIDEIKKAVSQYFDLKPGEIVSKRRTKNLSFPRHIAMYLCRKHTTASYPEIGSQFGGRDHSSVIHSANVVSTKIHTEKEVKTAIEEIERRIFGH